MSSESSSLSCKRGPIFLDEGRSQMQLLRIRRSHLFLLDPEENILLQSGDFVLSLVMQPHSPLAAVMATVGDVQWPLGTDSPAMKLGSKLYSFALLGLIYGLQLTTEEEEDQKLEALLQLYCAFPANVDISEDLKLQGCARATLNLEKGILIKPRMMKRVQHARRVSAIAKLFSKALVRRVINPMIHVNTANASTTTSSSSSWSPSSSIPDATRLIEPESFKLVNVNAFAQVLEAVETGGESLLNYTSYVNETQTDGAWTLNKMGLQALFRAATQTVALNMREASYCSFDHGAFASAESAKTVKSTRLTSSMSQNDGSTCSSNIPHPRLPKPLIHSLSKSVSKPPTPNRTQYRPSSTSTHSSSSSMH